MAGSLTDLAGVTRAKYVPLQRLSTFEKSGMGVSPSWSVFCVDSGIAFTPDIGVVGDLRIRIDPADMRVIDNGVAWAPADLYDQHGNPAPLCTRSLLAGIERGATDRGLNVLAGAELEFTLLSADGDHASAGPWSPYGMRTSLDRSVSWSISRSPPNRPGSKSNNCTPNTVTTRLRCRWLRPGR